jgi:hypothetical protein
MEEQMSKLEEEKQAILNNQSLIAEVRSTQWQRDLITLEAP